MLHHLVQESIGLVAIKVHNAFEIQDSVHRDVIYSRHLFGYVPDLETIVPVYSGDVALVTSQERGWELYTGRVFI
jgi:hypothetical protein